ncbi:hypothetical protein M427DRAFT_44123 [Gonapodya prolifera JEL478]|uniref:Uncharacterized protein n=1 Tax=Gonapodya prolifera (strain JEL478) TaxID=1344416 RepID=A0A139AGJ7_GONPJ|nr:hypothetical protein M427DRAFT_44123 [Gonapodya prolifera JEL478]|eukprot:KXS15952.1 hypothetical protein M427DRAFT_44123 [Gonapodya prolifera JEL478]
MALRKMQERFFIMEDVTLPICLGASALSVLIPSHVPERQRIQRRLPFEPKTPLPARRKIIPAVQIHYLRVVACTLALASLVALAVADMPVQTWWWHEFVNCVSSSGAKSAEVWIWQNRPSDIQTNWPDYKYKVADLGTSGTYWWENAETCYTDDAGSLNCVKIISGATPESSGEPTQLDAAVWSSITQILTFSVLGPIGYTKSSSKYSNIIGSGYTCHALYWTNDSPHIQPVISSGGGQWYDADDSNCGSTIANSIPLLNGGSAQFGGSWAMPYRGRQVNDCNTCPGDSSSNCYVIMTPQNIQVTLYKGPFARGPGDLQTTTNGNHQGYFALNQCAAGTGCQGSAVLRGLEALSSFLDMIPGIGPEMKALALGFNLMALVCFT